LHNSLDFGRDVLLVLADVLSPATKVSNIINSNQGCFLPLGLLAFSGLVCLLPFLVRFGVEGVLDKSPMTASWKSFQVILARLRRPTWNALERKYSISKKQQGHKRKDPPDSMEDTFDEFSCLKRCIIDNDVQVWVCRYELGHAASSRFQCVDEGDHFHGAIVPNLPRLQA
jgi:hypothetical protein